MNLNISNDYIKYGSNIILRKNDNTNPKITYSENENICNINYLKCSNRDITQLAEITLSCNKIYLIHYYNEFCKLHRKNGPAVYQSFDNNAWKKKWFINGRIIKEEVKNDYEGHVIHIYNSKL